MKELTLWMRLIACVCALALLAACGSAGDSAAPQATGGSGETSSSAASNSGSDGEAGSNDPGDYTINDMYDFAIETLDLLWAGDEAVLDRLADATSTTLSGESMDSYYDLFSGSREMIEALMANEELLDLWKLVCGGNSVVLTQRDLPGEERVMAMTGQERISHYMWFDLSDIEQWIAFGGAVQHGLGELYVQMGNAEFLEGFSPSNRRINEGPVTVIVDQNGELRMVLKENALDSLCGIPDMHRVINNPRLFNLGSMNQLEETGYRAADMAPAEANLPYAAALAQIVDTVNSGRVVEALRAYAALLEEYGVEPSVSISLDGLDAYDALSAAQQAVVDEILAATTHAELYAMQRAMDGSTHRLFVALQTFDSQVSHTDTYSRYLGDDFIQAQAVAELASLSGVDIADIHGSGVWNFWSYDGPESYGFGSAFGALEHLVKQ